MMPRLVYLIKKYRSSSYLKNILGQAGWMFIGQLIPIIFSPILTRLYDELALAEITGMMALGSLVMVFAALNLNSPIIIEKNHGDARQLLTTGFVSSLLISSVLALLIALFPEFFISNFKIDNVAYYVPVYVLCFSCLSLFYSWQIRIKQFNRKAQGKIIESVVYILFAILIFYVAGKNTWGIAVGKIVGIIVAILILGYLSRDAFARFSIKKAKSLLIRYRDFPVYNMPSSFIKVISLQILVVFLGAYYTKSDLGFFSLANMVVLAPVALISQSISDIFFQKVVENYNEGNYPKARLVFYNTLLLLTIVAAPIFLVLFLGSRTLFPMVFGSNWEITGYLASVLSFVFLFKVIISPLGTVLIAINKVKLNSLWQLGRFIFLLALLYYAAAIVKADFYTFINYYVIGTLISYLFYLGVMAIALEKLVKSGT